jgi:L-serine deaminase
LLHFFLSQHFFAQCDVAEVVHDSLRQRLVHFSATLVALSHSHFELLADVAEHMNKKLVERVNVLGYQRAIRSFAAAMANESERVPDADMATIINIVMRYFEHLFEHELANRVE